MTAHKTKPGSDEAVERGCTCPVMDNAQGKGWNGAEGMYWINGDCPLHGHPDTSKEAGDGQA